MYQIQTMPVGAFQCNCTVIGCDQTKDAVVIDPGDEGDRIAAMVEAGGYKVTYILHTHAHLDHFGATGEIKSTLGGKVGLHRDDQFLYDAAEMQAAMMGMQPCHPPRVDHYLQDDSDIPFGKHRLTCIHTPGHTPGSTSFLLEDSHRPILFSGDTLFRRSIGRTDLPGGNPQQIVNSIKKRLFCLDGDTMIIPGHGPETRIGEEIFENPFVGKRA